MTAKQLFEYALIELNKKEAPSLLLEDYNYFINKAVNQYINKIYNAYDVTQQKTDDLRVLKATAVLTPINLPYLFSCILSAPGTAAICISGSLESTANTCLTPTEVNLGRITPPETDTCSPAADSRPARSE